MAKGDSIPADDMDRLLEGKTNGKSKKSTPSTKSSASGKKSSSRAGSGPSGKKSTTKPKSSASGKGSTPKNEVEKAASPPDEDVSVIPPEPGSPVPYRKPARSEEILSMVEGVLKVIVDSGYQVEERYSIPEKGEFNFVERSNRFSLRLSFEAHSPENFRLLYEEEEE